MSEVYVVGHRNPDTDSICSAIAYANLKNKITGTEDYHPYRAGQLNEETQFVLKKCDVAVPPLLQDVRVQVSDLKIRKTESVKSTISMKNAWNLMKELGVITLPVVKNKKLEGLITITDIWKLLITICLRRRRQPTSRLRRHLKEGLCALTIIVHA